MNIQCIAWLAWCVVEAETEVAQSRPSPYRWQIFPGLYAGTVVKDFFAQHLVSKNQHVNTILRFYVAMLILSKLKVKQRSTVVKPKSTGSNSPFIHYYDLI